MSRSTDEEPTPTTEELAQILAAILIARARQDANRIIPATEPTREPDPSEASGARRSA